MLAGSSCRTLILVCVSRVASQTSTSPLLTKRQSSQPSSSRPRPRSSRASSSLPSSPHHQARRSPSAWPPSYPHSAPTCPPRSSSPHRPSNPPNYYVMLHPTLCYYTLPDNESSLTLVCLIRTDILPSPGCSRLLQCHCAYPKCIQPAAPALANAATMYV